MTPFLFPLGNKHIIGFPNWFDYLDAFDIAARPTASHSDYENLFSVIATTETKDTGSQPQRASSWPRVEPRIKKITSETARTSVMLQFEFVFELSYYAIKTAILLISNPE